MVTLNLSTEETICLEQENHDYSSCTTEPFAKMMLEIEHAA